MRRNDEAALLATVSAVFLLLTGYSGARSVRNFFELLVDIFGDRAFLIALAYAFVAIASLGGFAVLAGGYLIWKDRVRTGRLLILIGSGAGLFTLLLFLLVQIRRGNVDLLLSVLPAILGVAIGIIARLRAKATPIL
ncbi:MAG: hypothetical protein E6K14_03180 [Methanobacteriota archaeon]|nr:MAG: hypothetical protein E6K14_03180 [Euryarchaeota archaeon]